MSTRPVEPRAAQPGWGLVGAGRPLPARRALALFFVLPVAGMVGRGLRAGRARSTSGGVLEVLGRPRVHRVLWFTRLVRRARDRRSRCCSGVPVAFVLYRLRFPGRGLLRAFVLMPFVMPTVVVGVAFRHPARVRPARSGGLGLDGTAGRRSSRRWCSSTWPSWCAPSARSGPASTARREEAAAALGASPLQVLRTVTLPALLPGIVSAASVVFLFCATAFGVVLTLGGLRYATVETEIYLLTTQLLDLQGAAALSVLQLVVVSVLLYGAQRTRARREHALDRTGERDATRRPRRRDLPVLAVTALVLALRRGPAAHPACSARCGSATRWGLGHYRDLADHRRGQRAAGAGDRPRWRTPGGSRSTPRCSRCCSGCWSRWPSRAGPGPGPGAGRSALLDSVFMLPLGVSAVTLASGSWSPSTGRRWTCAARRCWCRSPRRWSRCRWSCGPWPRCSRSLEPRQRQAAASLGASPAAGGCSPSTCRWSGGRCSPRPGSRSRCRSASSAPPASWPAPRTPTLPVVIYQLDLAVPGEPNFGMALAASVVLGLVTVAVMAAVERLRLGSVGAF